MKLWTEFLNFFNPEYLNISISLLSKIFIKNNWIVINKIKGNISNKSAGEFNKDKKNMKLVLTFSSLKKSISLNKFNIKD